MQQPITPADADGPPRGPTMPTASLASAIQMATGGIAPERLDGVKTARDAAPARVRKHPDALTFAIRIARSAALLTSSPSRPFSRRLSTRSRRIRTCMPWQRAASARDVHSMTAAIVWVCVTCVTSSQRLVGSRSSCGPCSVPVTGVRAPNPFFHGLQLFPARSVRRP